MKTIKIGKHEAQVYDSIDELPVERWHKFQRYALIDAGIGADLDAADRRLERARRFVMAGKNDKAVVELDNLRQAIFFVQGEISPAMRAYAALIVRLDGVACDDLSDDGLAAVTKKLNDAPVGVLTALFEAVKKKIDTELSLYFPTLFAGSEVKEYYDLLRARAVKILSGILEGVGDPLSAAEAETTAVMTFHAPRVFSGAESAEIAFDRQFAYECAVIGEQLHAEAKRMTAMEFYNAIALLRERAREAQKGAKRAK